MFHPPPSQVNFLTAWLVQLHHCPTRCFPTTHLLHYQHSAGLPCSLLHREGGYCLFHLKRTIKDDIKVWNCWCSDLPPWYSSQILTFHATLRWKELCFTLYLWRPKATINFSWFCKGGNTSLTAGNFILKLKKWSTYDLNNHFSLPLQLTCIVCC